MVPLLLQVWSQPADVGAILFVCNISSVVLLCSGKKSTQTMVVQHQAGLLALNATHSSWHGLA